MSTSPAADASQNQIHLISSAEMTANRVSTILRIVESLGPKIANFDDDEEYFGEPVIRGKFEGGAKAAAEATFITALNRLDKILEQDDLWHSQSVDRLLADGIEGINAVRLQTANQELLRAREMNRPYKKYGAKVGILPNNTFVAFVGESLSDPTVIYASGNSIPEALDKLDAILTARGNTDSST